MRKYLLIITIFIFTFLPFISYAAESSVILSSGLKKGSEEFMKVTFSTDKSNAVANGSDSIILRATIYAKQWAIDLYKNAPSSLNYGNILDKPMGEPVHYPLVEITGSDINMQWCDINGCHDSPSYSGNLCGLIKTTPKISFYATNNVVCYDTAHNLKPSNGYLKFTSNKVGERTLTLYLKGLSDVMAGLSSALWSTKINFISPTSSPKPTTKATTKTTNTTTKPSAPIVTKLSNKDIQKNSDGNFIPTIIRQGTPITLSGTTSANATVHLTIKSDPISADVIADADGNWTYTLDQELALGDHTVDATVTDSAGKTSDSATIASFTLKAPIPALVSPESTPRFVITPIIWVLVVTDISLIGTLVWLEIKRRKKFKLTKEVKSLI